MSCDLSRMDFQSVPNLDGPEIHPTSTTRRSLIRTVHPTFIDSRGTMNRLTFLSPVVTLCLLALVPARSALFAADKLAPRIEAQLALPHFKHAHWGLLVVDLKS